jgi:hypothetical protein
MNDKDEVLFLPAGIGCGLLPVIAMLHGWHGELALLSLSFIGFASFGLGSAFVWRDGWLDARGNLATRHRKAIIRTLEAACLLAVVACCTMARL